MINKEKIEQAVQLLLEGMGEDATRPGLIETPERAARMYEEILSGYGDCAERHLSKTFPVTESGMILEKDIQFYSSESSVVHGDGCPSDAVQGDAVVGCSRQSLSFNYIRQQYITHSSRCFMRCRHLCSNKPVDQPKKKFSGN